MVTHLAQRPIYVLTVESADRYSTPPLVPLVSLSNRFIPARSALNSRLATDYQPYALYVQF